MESDAAETHVYEIGRLSHGLGQGLWSVIYIMKVGNLREHFFLRFICHKHFAEKHFCVSCNNEAEILATSIFRSAENPKNR